MKTIKQEALQAIASLPDSTEIEDIMYRLYVIDKIRQGQEDVLNGKFMTTEDFKKEISRW
jgi:predicted transcriptional regulator